MVSKKKKFDASAKNVPKINGQHEWSGNSYGHTAGARRDHFEAAQNEKEWEAMWDNLGLPKPGRLPNGAIAVAIFCTAEEAGSKIEIGQIRRVYFETPEGKAWNNSQNPHLEVNYKIVSLQDAPAASASPWTVKLLNGPCDMVTVHNEYSKNSYVAQPSTFFNKKTIFG